MAKRGFLDGLIKSFVRGLQKPAPPERRAARRVDREPLGFPVGIVGESQYQDAIRRCREGEPVTLIREPGNPYDSNAIAVVCPRGKTLGYIARDNFVQRAVHQEKQQIEARILSLNTTKGNIGIVLDVELLGRGDQPIGERPYER